MLLLMYVISVQKICKKHDKDSLYKQLENNILEIIKQDDYFGNNKIEKYLIDRLENLYSHCLLLDLLIKMKKQRK